MSSTNKTSFLKLNSWLASDKPQRKDFNYDNEKLDEVIGNHFNDYTLHISDDERNKWDSPTYTGRYFGDGQPSRTIETKCPFEPTLVVIFAETRPISLIDFSQKKKYNYIAFLTQLSSTLGSSLSEYGKYINVEQSVNADLDNEYTSLNEIGVAYAYVMFR